MADFSNIKFPNLADILANSEKIKEARGANQRNQAVLEDALKRRATAGRMAPLVNQGNLQGASDVAAQEGDLEQVQSMQTAKTAQVTAQQTQLKEKLKLKLEMGEYLAPILHEIAQKPDQRERSALVQTAISGVAAQMDALEKGWSEQVLNQVGDGDKGRLAVAAAAGMKVTDQLRTALDLRKQDFEEGDKFTLEQEKADETAAQNELSNQYREQEIGLRQQGIGLQQQELNQGGKPPPGYTWQGPGQLSFIPGGPGDPALKPLGETQQKMLVGANNTISSITDYVDALEKFNISGILNPNELARIQPKYANMKMQAKEAYNLGVLNPNDNVILEQIFTDPVSVKGVITSKNALKEQAKELQRIMGNIAATAAQRQQPQSGGPEIPQERMAGAVQHTQQPPAGMSPEKIQYTAKKYGMTPEQVMQMMQQRLGAQ
jgi:hypothetical protein